MNRQAPTIDNAWASFETDLKANDCTAADIEFFKLIWMGGAMAMGIILTSKENALSDKVDAFNAVATWLASRPQFARFGEPFKNRPHAPSH